MNQEVRLERGIVEHIISYQERNRQERIGPRWEDRPENASVMEMARETGVPFRYIVKRLMCLGLAKWWAQIDWQAVKRSSGH